MEKRTAFWTTRILLSVFLLIVGELVGHAQAWSSEQPALAEHGYRICKHPDNQPAQDACRHPFGPRDHL